MVSGKVPVFECVRGAWQFLLRNVQLLVPAAAICAAVRPVCVPSNEQNFDRLAAELRHWPT